VIQWVQQKQRYLTGVGLLLAVVAGGIWFTVSARERRERFAAGQLNQARAAVDAGNFQLAASDLSRLVTDYGATRAGQEGAILLARVQLQMGQPEVAVAQLRTLLSQNPAEQFVAQGQGLLGSALEQMGQFGAAADAFVQAANASRYELIKAELLLDAGRAATLAGDTERAASLYQRVIDEITEDAGSVSAAHVRLSELRR
jgi:predicted negative regulator of RcsB-dependent stress response